MEYTARRRFAFALVAGILAMLVVAASLLLPTQSAQAGLPPRPTPQAGSGSDAGGAPIELRVRFGQGEQARRWQELWTVVQWQDTFGNWHDVEGWRGTLDEIVDGEGRQVWWVYRRDLGKGPFRWMVYQSPSGGLLVRSESFHLPGADGQTVEVAVSLKP